MKQYIDLLKAEKLPIFGLKVYHSKFRYDLTGGKDKDIKKDLEFVYNFKKFNKRSAIVKAFIIGISNHFECDLIIPVPGSKKKENNLQRLFGSGKIKRIADIKSKKYAQKLDFKKINRESLYINTSQMKGKKILLVDDICTTGDTLLLYKELLEEQNVNDVILFAVGINKKLNPFIITEIDLSISKESELGRPSKINDIDYGVIELLAKRGFTDKEMSYILQITEKTWNNWKNKNEDFFQSLKDNKGIADGKVEASFFQRACGYFHPEDKIFLYEGEPVIVPTIKHYPPDTAAGFIWLKNRCGWQDKMEMKAEVTEMPAIDFSKLSTPKLRVLKALLEEAKPDKKEKENG